jgi:hypothetical protein
MSIDVESSPNPVLAPSAEPHSPELNSTEPKLIPALSSRWVFGFEHLAVTAFFCALVLLLNHLPLRNTDLWGHAVYGQYILEHRALPTSDLLEPLAEGMRVVDVHWLSQTIFAAVERVGGAEALLSLFTAVVGLTYLILGRTFYLLTKSPALSAVVTLLVLIVGWNRVATIRPENFAVLLFATLLWLMIGRRLRRADSILADDTRGDDKLWVAVPLIAGLWANLHGSFPICIATLGCFWLGRVLEVAWHERSLRAVLVDREVRRLLYWTELAFAATLVNPYGIDAWIEAVRFSSNLNLREVLEWAPLVIVGTAGREFALACVALGVVCRYSRKPIAPADVLLLLLFGTAATMQVRMTGWFAIVWGIAFAPHLADAVLQWCGRVRFTEPPRTTTDEEEEIDAADMRTPALRYRYTLCCAGLVWIAFCFTTFSVPVIGGDHRTPDQLYAEATPRAVADWLKTQQLDGLAYAPQYWGDWIGWTAPPGLKLFATTNVHLLPRTAWLDYLRLTRADTGWANTADKYNVRTMIVDKREQPTLLRSLKGTPDWAPVYEDEQAIVFRRKNLIAATSPASAAAAAPSTASAAEPKH